MKRVLTFSLAALAIGAGSIESASARDFYGDRYYDNRRESRRQAIVAGAIRNKIATDRAEQNYRECMRESGYDRECDRQRWEDEQDARKKGRRAAIIVGAD